MPHGIAARRCTTVAPQGNPAAPREEVAGGSTLPATSAFTGSVRWTIRWTRAAQPRIALRLKRKTLRRSGEFFE